MRWVTVQAQAGARVVVDGDGRADLGVVALGTDPEVRVTLRNQGDAPLTVSAGRVAAGLRVEHVDTPIAAGASGEVRLRLETFKVGQTRDWTIPLTTSDPQRDTVILQVHADVRTFVLITPPTARFTYVQHEREGGTTHLVGAAGDPSFRVTRVESPYPFLDATASPAPLELTSAETTITGVRATIEPIEPGRRWHVRVGVAPTAPGGAVRGELRLRTSRADVPPVIVPLSRP